MREGIVKERNEKGEPLYKTVDQHGNTDQQIETHNQELSFALGCELEKIKTALTLIRDNDFEGKFTISDICSMALDTLRQTEELVDTIYKIFPIIVTRTLEAAVTYDANKEPYTLYEDAVLDVVVQDRNEA